MPDTLRHGPPTPRWNLADRSGEEIFRSTCAGCHSANGAGAPRTTVGFAVPLPDFTDCNFASRETSADWYAIVRDGGPVRGFSRIMPAFRYLLTPDEIRNVVAYVHTFCSDKRWPRGEFNLPLALVTEKAFPEDELVLTGRGRDERTRVVRRTISSSRSASVHAISSSSTRHSGSRTGPTRAGPAGSATSRSSNKYVFFSSLDQRNNRERPRAASSCRPEATTRPRQRHDGLRGERCSALSSSRGGASCSIRDTIEIPTQLALAPRSGLVERGAGDERALLADHAPLVADDRGRRDHAIS